jgi:hypothetical protein
MSEKGIGSKFIGLFVESDGQSAPQPSGKPGQPKSAADLVAELAQQSGAPKPNAAAHLPEVKLIPSAPPATPGAPIDFDAVFKGAGMDPSELDRVKKAEDLLRSLPDATPLAVKKQIVEASLKAFGFEIEKILGAAANQKRALDAYVKVNEQHTTKAIQDAETQIRSFTEKIALLRAEIEKRTQTLTQVTNAATGRKAEVQKVIEFFQPPANPA